MRYQKVVLNIAWLLLIGLMTGCIDSDAEDPVTPPDTQPPTDNEQVLHEPLLVDAPLGIPATVASYRVEPVGPFEEEGSHLAVDLNESGQVAGESEAANDDKVSWLYSGGSTLPIGLSNSFTPPEFGDHYSRTEPFELNNQGQVIGETNDQWFVEGTDDIFFKIAWLYSSGENIRLSLPGSDLADPENGSELAGLNEAGQVAGHTWVENRKASWLYSDGEYQSIGLTDIEHTAEDGEQNSEPEAINDSGDVVGWSERYLGPNPGGSSCWLYRDGTTYQIGLLDQEHTHAPSGRRDCSPRNLNESAQVIGESTDYNEDSLSWEDFRSYSAWLYSDGQTHKIGLTDTDHTSSDGHHDSVPAAINGAGQVIGLSESYYSTSSGAEEGRSVWFYENGVTRDITLTGSEYTRFDGRRVSSLEPFTGSGLLHWISLFERGGMGTIDMVSASTGNPRFNDAGHVVGYSTRYGSAKNVSEVGQPEGNLGQTAWLYKNGNHIKLGIMDAAHTDSDGAQSTLVASLNQAGQVAGHSKRYGPGAEPLPCDDAECEARTAWFFDPKSDRIYRLILSTRADGFTVSDVISLSEDGTVLGYYLAFEDGSNAFQWRLFTFSLENGLQAVEISGFGMENWHPSEPLTYDLTNNSGHFVGVTFDSGSLPQYLFSPLEK